jgi:hypothetical protein
VAEQQTANSQATGPLSPLVTGWLDKIALSAKHKKEQFGDDAEECLKFYHGPYNWLYERKNKKSTSFDFDPESDDDIPPPTFQLSINKAAEVVHLFGPAMYQRNPDRLVSPRKSFQPPLEYFGSAEDPATQMQFTQWMGLIAQERGRDLTIARLFEELLNYTPAETNLRDESRLVVDEALIKGMGVWWTELCQMPSGLRTVGSFFDSVDNLFLDPDATRWEDCAWYVRRCIHPTWQIEQEYGLEPGTLKGNLESGSKMAEMSDSILEGYKRAQGNTSDLLVYYKIYSKMGMGGRLKEVMTQYPEWKETLDQVAGDYCFIAIADGVENPLNLTPEIIAQGAEAVQQAVAWPVPYWLDKGGAPFTPLAFHRIPGRLWPVSHLSPALGELKFINWIYSFLTGKIRVACRDFIVMMKSAAKEVKRAIQHGPDFSLIEVMGEADDVDKIVKFIQHPTFNAEIYRVLEHMMELFDKRTGLTDLMYGQTATQLRSAHEAEVKNTNASVRPDDMAQQVEDASSELARKEMAAARWLLTDQDVKPAVGTVGAFIWQTEVMTNTSPADLFHQYECKVEAGSTKRQNKEAIVKSLDVAMQNLSQMLYGYAQQTGDVGPINGLVGDWANGHGLDGEKYILRPPPPPAPPTAGAPPPGGAKVAA